MVAGRFGDHRSGTETFLEPVKPRLSFRYRTEHSLGVLGRLVIGNRLGYLEPLEVTTLEFTRPIESGLQWRERRSWLDGEFFLNWQARNTPTSREIFDYGLLLPARPIRHVQQEYGIRKIVKIDQTVTVDGEFRFHRIDDEPSQAIGNSKWECSYRLFARVPFASHVQ